MMRVWRMEFNNYFEKSEKQLKLIEELQEILKLLEEAPADVHTSDRVLEILKELRELRGSLKEIPEGEGEDFELLKRFYNLVGVHDEKEILEELLKHVVKGRIDIPKDIILEEIKDNEDFAKRLK